jgi:hypothetical protein
MLMSEAASSSKMSLTKFHTLENSRGSVKTENRIAKEPKRPYILEANFTETFIYNPLHMKFRFTFESRGKKIKAVISFE